MLARLVSKVASFTAKNQYFYGITPQFMHELTPELLLSEESKTTKRTKTVCTIGPKSESPEMAGKLIDAGLNVARLNFSHGDHAEHLNQMKGVQEALKTRPNSNASILLDTKGPEIRTGNNAGGLPIILEKDQLLELTTDYNHLGTNERIACSYQDLPRSTAVGKRILFADGNISSIVKKIQNDIVTVQVLNDGKIGSRKNMCLRGATLNLPTVNKYDQYDIAEFGVKNKVDYIALSFTRYKTDITELRKFMISKDPIHGPNIHIISKIENHEGINNLDEIIHATDGIMVARGDLGMEVPIEKVALLQKYIMGKSIDGGKYAICATQMVESMETKPRPTRAEVSDITNSVLDLADSTMTSGETTNGQFPVECVGMLRKISQETELTVAYKKIFQYKKNRLRKLDKEACGSIALSFQVVADVIFLETDSVSLINRLSCLRPRAYLIVFSDMPYVKGLTAINFGVYVFTRSYAKNPEEFLNTVGRGFVSSSKRVKALTLETNHRDEIFRHTIARYEIKG